MPIARSRFPFYSRSRKHEARGACVAGRQAGGDADEEFTEATRQVYQIAWFRLQDVVKTL